MRILWALSLVFVCTISCLAQDAGEVPPKELALNSPRIASPPGAEYAGANRLFQGIPGIERASNGRLWATWYGGGKEEGPENYVMLSTSGDDGVTWPDITLAIDPEGIVRAFDPCLWRDPNGTLWLFWAQGVTWWDGRAGVWAMTANEPENPHPQWSAPRRLCDGIMMNKPTVLRSGAWLLPAAIWAIPANTPDPKYSIDTAQPSGSWVVCSTDNGKTFAPLGRSDVKDRKCDEHMVVELSDGKLWMLVRTGYGIGESFSTDGGRTWSEGRPSETVKHIDSAARFFIRRLASGKLLLVKHAPPENHGRSHLTAFLSGDDGKTWKGGLLIDERAGVSYPDGVEAPDGLIYVIYDYSRKDAREILMATFTEEDVLEGKPVSGKTRFRVLVNKAGPMHVP
ncbi:MAG TPA: sialidase family protein [Candidatus Hydrogenedentes bacterium]|nr:sialidase family protein [Candidatus Hydrogenedentota bacterium]